MSKIQVQYVEYDHKNVKAHKLHVNRDIAIIALALIAICGTLCFIVISGM
jgi:hypothetical protein